MMVPCRSPAPVETRIQFTGSLPQRPITSSKKGNFTSGPCELETENQPTFMARNAIRIAVIRNCFEIIYGQWWRYTEKKFPSSWSWSWWSCAWSCAWAWASCRSTLLCWDLLPLDSDYYSGCNLLRSLMINNNYYLTAIGLADESAGAVVGAGVAASKP